MGTSITDLRLTEGDERALSSAPELPVMWTADEDMSDGGFAHVAHRVLIANGSHPMTANVRIEETVELDDLETLGFTLVRLHRSSYGTSVFMTGEGVALSGFIGRGNGSVHVSTADLAALDKVVAQFGTRFPGKATANAMEIRSWSLGRFGANPTVVRHDFPDWAATQANFPANTRGIVGELVALERPVGGSVMVWHGPPGTGKTTAIRSLAREWRPWCDLELVIDPEALFSNAGYLMGVLTSGPLGSPETEMDVADDDAPLRWKLVVVEDCDDLLLRSEQSGSNGQLSRLLNVCDGLLGQELNVIVLFTTNAPLHAIHPAVLRPGRCLATVEFGPFSPVEVAARGSGVDAHEMTLAELMAAEGGLPDVVGAKPEERVNGYL